MIKDALPGGGVSIPPRFVRDGSDIRSGDAASFFRGSGQFPPWRARNRSRVMESELAEEALVSFFVHRKKTHWTPSPRGGAYSHTRRPVSAACFTN